MFEVQRSRFPVSYSALHTPHLLHSPALNATQGSLGRSRNKSLIHSNCGCAAKYLFAENAIPHPEPQRAANDIRFAIAASTTFASTVPLPSKGTPCPCPPASASR